MANEVKIIINAVDQASGSMKGMFGGFTELSSALGLLEKGLGYLDKAFDATVGQFTKYAEQVEDLSRVTGMSAEETSKLIQVADDLFVEYGTLKTAARQLAKDGMIPNIETMAQLSDKYLSFKTDTERVAWATKEFGRNYSEMTKILEAGGDAIRKAAANQPGGLILSEKDLENAKVYKQSLDQLNDTFSAIGISIGKIVVPELVKFLTFVVDSIKWIDEWGKAQNQARTDAEGFAAATKKQGETYEEYAARVRVAALADQRRGDQYVLLTKAQWEAGFVTDNLTRAYTAQAEAANYAATEGDTYNQSLLAAIPLAETQKARIEATNEAYEQQQINADDLARATDAGTYSMLQYNYAQGNVVTTLKAIGLSSDEAAKSIRGDLKGAMDDLATATANWKETVASAAISAIKSTEGLSEAQVTQLIAATDSMMGTTYLATEQMQKDLAAAVEQFKKTGDISDYEESIQTIADKFESTLAPGIKKAQDQVDQLQKALKLLAATPIDVTVNVHVQYPDGPLPGGTTPTNPNPIRKTGKGKASGGLVTEPGLYPLAEQGPELVIPAGKTKDILSGEGGGSTTFNFYPANESAARAVAGSVVSMMRAQARAARMGG